VTVAVSARAVVESAVVGLLLGVIAFRQGWDAGGVVAACAVALLLPLCALAHEAGHLVAARRHGLAVVALRIEGALGGGVERQVSPDPLVERRIALAGPAVTVALALAGAASVVAGGPLLPLGLALVGVNLLALLGSVVPWSRSDLGRAWAARGRAPAG
jgi:Zn-dependent protease